MSEEFSILERAHIVAHHLGLGLRLLMAPGTSPTKAMDELDRVAALRPETAW